MGKPKPGIKDPNVSPTLQALRTLVARKTIGLVAGGVALQLVAKGPLRPLAERWLSSSSSGRYNWVSIGGCVIVAGTAGSGFALGYGLVTATQWLRRTLIARLLTYSGWLFDQSSRKTMAWGLLLKLLIGPGPHKLFEFEDILPRLPLPSLEHTCERYLETVRPLLTKDEFDHTLRLVNEFRRNPGPTLQKYLEERSKQNKSWLADWWLTYAYLARREPIALNVNFCMLGTILPEVSNNSLARCTLCLHSVTRYYEMIQDETLPPDMIMDIIPVCMDSVRYMLGSCRIPGEHVDTMTITPHSKHVIIVSKGVYYRLNMYASDGKGRIVTLNKSEIRHQLEIIRRQTEDVRDKNAVAVLTATDRATWFNNRQMLLRSSCNAATLKEIESAIFILVLGDYTPKDISEQARLALTGDGTDRWFDKGLTIEMYKDCSMGVGNMEHTGADATHFNVMWEHCLQLEEFGPDGDNIIDPAERVRPNLPPPLRLEWDFSEEMKSTIQRTLSEYRKTLETIEVVVYHTKYGKKWMKIQRVSPDGYLQMAIQLAFWRTHREFTKTYEPASHRLFALGRTDNINPVSEHSIQWVHAMDSPLATSQEKIRLLQTGIRHQSRVRLDATAGLGSDRHLLGLACAARDLGMETPDIFKDKAYQLPMRLSTSQVPTNVGHLGLDLIPESCLGGFGPVCDDGYGLLYCSMGDDMFNFFITSWRTCNKTDSAVLARAIDVALEDMRRLMEGRTAPVPAVSKPNL